jgi:hypothetical protein
MAFALPPALQKGALISFLVLVGACQPRIGDDCRRDLECSQARDRICDTTQLGGYCTQFNCTPTSCPKGESICVAFSNTPSTVPRCSNPGQTSPYVRNFCMGICENDSNCRSGYICADMAEENAWGAASIQLDRTHSKVCIVPQTSAEIEPDRDNQVCTGEHGGAGGEASDSGGAPGQ